MVWQYNPYALSLIFTTGISAALASYIWQRRPAPGAASFALLMAAVAEWSLAYALRLGSPDLQAKIFWSQVRNLGVAVTPVAWLAFALQYTGWGKWLTRRNVVLLSIEPLVALLLAWTNGRHGLFWSHISLDSGGSFPTWVAAYGPCYWINAVYSYLLILLGTVLLIHKLVRFPALYRRQMGALLISVLTPLAGQLGSALHLLPSFNLNLTPFAFTISGLAAAWGLFRHRLFDIVPVARDAVIENMSDAVIVLDAQERIVDLNPAAERIVGHTAAEIIGQPLVQVLPVWPTVAERAHRETGAHAEVAWGEGDATSTYDLRTSPLRDQRGRDTGCLVVLRDITELKQAEEALRRAREDLEIRVQERTAELATTNEALQSQIAERKQTEEALQESEARLRSIVQTATEAIITVDSRGNIVFWNRAAEAMFGYPADAIVGPPSLSLISEQFQADYQAVVKRVKSAGETSLSGKTVEMVGLKKDGSEFPLEISWAAWETRGEIFLTGIVRDITARVRSEQERARAEEELMLKVEQLTALSQASQTVTASLELDQVLTEIVSLASEVVDLDYTSVLLVDEAGHIGQSAENLPGVPAIGYRIREEGLTNWIVRSGQAVVVDEIGAGGAINPSLGEGAPRFANPLIVETGVKSFAGLPMVVKDNMLGVIYLHSLQPAAFRDQLPLLTAFANQAAIAVENARLYRESRSYARQLEQRVQERTAQLQAQYARLEAILSSASDGIIVTDGNGNIVQANPVVETWLSRTLSPENATRLREAVRVLAQRAGEKPKSVLELPGLDLELEAASVAEEEVKEELAVVVIAHDVSHLKTLDRMKTRFVSNVSHELRTPIATIKLYAELMRRRPERWEEYLDTLTEEANHQARLVEYILQISRLDAGRLDMSPRPTHLGGLVEASVANHQALARERGLTLEHRPMETSEGELGPVALVDTKRMTQVLNNLVENSIRYTPKGGRVTISTSTEKAKNRAWVTVTVADTGIGIPNKEMSHIFERFFRGEDVRLMQIPGTGLGLAIVKEIVELHGGWVTVESQVGKGTVFTAWLPLAD